MASKARSHRRRLVFLALAAAFVAAAGFSISAFCTSVPRAFTAARSGTVVDADTEKSLSGAHVVVRWWYASVNRFPPYGHGHAGGFSECLHREVTTTDANGRYALPAVDRFFTVNRTFDFSRKTEYFWHVEVYLPGYYNPIDTGRDYRLHPPISGGLLGSTVEVAPILLTKDRRSPRGERIYYLTWKLGFSCEPATADPVPFAADLYHEAFRLACESGPPTRALKVAALRRDVRSGMPPLSKEILQELDKIKSRYGPNGEASAADNVRLCELLAQAEEIAP